MNQACIGFASLLASLAVHGGVLLGNASAPFAPPVAPAPTFVQLAVTPATPKVEELPEPLAPEPPEPPKPPTPKPERRLLPEPEASEPEASEPKAPELESPPEEPSPPFTGTTLVSDEGAGWSAAQGDGSARDGAIRSGAIRPANDRSLTTATSSVRHRSASSPELPRPPEVIPLSRLSKKPEPPPLTAALQRNYPTEARSLGRSGEAKVRARIEATGVVRVAELSFESASGFGEACRKTLLESRWSVPLDPDGRPTATWVTYRCKFRIND